MDLRVEIPEAYEPERRWTLDVVLRVFLGLEHEVIVGTGRATRITSKVEPGRSLVLSDGLFATPPAAWLGAASLPSEPLRGWRPTDDGLDAHLLQPALPVAYGAPLPNGAWLARETGALRIGADLLGGAFFWLSRYEEIARPERDRHDRFPARASLSARTGLLDVPVVDEYAEVLRACLDRLWPGLAPRRRAARLRPSHDVDVARWVVGQPLRRVGRSLAADLLVRRDPELAAARLRSVLAARRGKPNADLCDTYDFLMDVSERHGLVSEFNFMTGRTHPSFDGDDEPDVPWLRTVLRRIHERGHAVGLHPSYGSHLDSEILARELDALRRICDSAGVHQERFGGRQHYLRWRNPETWRAWAAAGLAHDSTVGFADRAGFRCGTSRPYPVFDLRTRRPLALEERPLIAMDTTLLRYEGLDASDAARRARGLAAACYHHGGDFTLLVHNNTPVTARRRHCYECLVRDLVP